MENIQNKKELTKYLLANYILKNNIDDLLRILNKLNVLYIRRKVIIENQIDIFVNEDLFLFYTIPSIDFFILYSVEINYDYEKFKNKNFYNIYQWQYNK